LKDSKRDELFDRLCRSLEEGNRKIHVIYVDDGETTKQAEDRYIRETGSSIEAGDVMLLVVYDDHLQLDE